VPDPLDILVLVLDDVLQVVVADELEDGVRGDVPRLGDRDRADRPRRVRASHEDLVRQEQAGALAAQPPVALLGHDQALAQLEEVVELEDVLRDPEVVQLLRQEPPHERHLHAAQDLAGDAGAVGGEVVEAPQGRADLAQGGARPGQDLVEERGLVLLEPLLQERHDGLAAQVLGGDLERPVGEQDGLVGVPVAAGDVQLAAHLVALAQHVRPLEDAARLLDPHPVEVVEHLARELEVERPVGGAQEPQRRVPGAQPVAVALSLPAPADGSHAPEQDEVAQPVGDRPQQPDLLFRERALVRIARGLGRVEADASQRLILDADGHADGPRRGLEVPRAVRRVPVGDERPGRLRRLHGGRDRRRDRREDLRQRPVRLAQALLDAVEAVQLLGALLEGAQQLDRVAAAADLVAHAAVLLCGPGIDRARPGLSGERPGDGFQGYHSSAAIFSGRRGRGGDRYGHGAGTGTRTGRAGSGAGRGRAGRGRAGAYAQPRSRQAFATRFTEVTYAASRM